MTEDVFPDEGMMTLEQAKVLLDFIMNIKDNDDLEDTKLEYPGATIADGTISELQPQ